MAFKQNQTQHWVDDAPADLHADEIVLKPRDLASFTKILVFSSKYWGGVSALLLMALCVCGLIYLVTHETLYETVRTWVTASVAATVALDGTALWLLVWQPIVVVVALGLLYFGAIKRFTLYKDRIHGWGLAFLVIALSTVNVKVGVELINWSGGFWESVKNKEVAAFIPGLVLFAQLAFFSIAASVYRIYFRQMLQVRWRTWLTENLSTRYLSDNRFYHLEQQRTQENPDQRIADDLDKYTDLGVSLFFGFYLAALSIYEYSKALIKISGNLEFEAFGYQVNIPNYMFWAVLVYTLIGSSVIHLIGYRLVKINVLMQRYNANFRYHLIRAREYAEGIVFLKGDIHHINAARQLFGVIRTNWFMWMKRIKYLGFASSVYAQGGIIFPVIVAVPRYFSGELKFGGIMQVIRAFGELREALSWFIDNYSALAELRATATRVFGLEHSLDKVDEFKQQSSLTVTPNNIGGIALTHVSLNRPQFDDAGVMHEQPQVLGLDWQISKGQRWLVTGASGSGKSTILRAVAALWPYGRGQIDVPRSARAQFLPQRPYFPIASLRDALAYPAMAEAYKDVVYETVLDMAQLKHLSSRLSEQANWGQMLSGGEQQRLAFARVFLQRPDYLFLDEATASLDIANETALYATLLAFLPNLTLVSVSHHEQLKPYHNHGLNLSADELGGFKAKLQVL